MTLPNDGGMAFPGEELVYQGNFLNGEKNQYRPASGMTLRDYFAAKAMQGMLADPQAFVKDWPTFAKCCFEAADAMLEAREAND